MNEVSTEISDQLIKITLSGHIDSNNAEEVKNEINSHVSADTSTPVIIEAEDLKYISSAGLRVLLQLRKNHPDIQIVDVSPEVYEILDITGFTQMMKVTRAYRHISIDGAEVIGRGANGTLYKIDNDIVVKVYHNSDSVDDIQQEREVARLALILGIPTAISYDIVKVGDSYGSVFELLNASSFSYIIANEPDRFDWCVDEYVGLLKKIHGTLVPKGKLPDMKATALRWADFMKDYLPPESGDKLISLVKAVPHDDHMIHGDYHTKNVVLAGDEVLLIDMDTLAVGDPVFEFASIFNAFMGFSELDPSQVEEFQGFDLETAMHFWHEVMKKYVGTDDDNILGGLADRARVIGYTRLIRRSIRRSGLEDEKKRAEIDHWKAELIELLDKIDVLSFNV